MHTAIHSHSLTIAGGRLRLVVLSDTHEYHRNVRIPNGDILIHAGDITRFSFSIRVIEDFESWLHGLPHRWKVVIPGNHDYGFRDSAWRNLIKSATLLINDGIEMGGLKIWGTPITPVDHGNFAGETATHRQAQFRRIPADTNVLISHGPPLGILDIAHNSSRHAGCQDLLEAVNRVNPTLHLFGHIHGGYGIAKRSKTLFANAALAGANGKPINGPHILDLCRS